MTVRAILHRHHAGVARVIGAAACLILSLWLGVRQAEALSLTSNRPYVEHTVAPGQVTRGSIELANQSSDPVRVSIYLQDWRYISAGDGSKEFAPAGTTPRSCANWVTLFPQQADIPGRGKLTVEYAIRVPDGQALDGGYYAILFTEGLIAEVSPNEDPEGILVKYSARLGSLFMINVRGTEKYQASLASLRVQPPGAGSMIIEGVFRNEGNVALTCQGSFHAQSAQGLILARGELPMRYSWPGDQVPIRAEWSGTMPSGQHQLVLTYDCGDQLIIGDEVPLTVP